MLNLLNFLLVSDHLSLLHFTTNRADLKSKSSAQTPFSVDDRHDLGDHLETTTCALRALRVLSQKTPAFQIAGGQLVASPAAECI